MQNKFVLVSLVVFILGMETAQAGGSVKDSPARETTTSKSVLLSGGTIRDGGEGNATGSKLSCGASTNAACGVLVAGVEGGLTADSGGHDL